MMSQKLLLLTFALSFLVPGQWICYGQPTDSLLYAAAYNRIVNLAVTKRYIARYKITNVKRGNMIGIPDSTEKRIAEYASDAAHRVCGPDTNSNNERVPSVHSPSSPNFLLYFYRLCENILVAQLVYKARDSDDLDELLYSGSGSLSMLYVLHLKNNRINTITTDELSVN